MKSLESSQIVLGFVAAAVAAGHLFVPDPAEAAHAGALFRVHREWHGDFDTDTAGTVHGPGSTTLTPDPFISPTYQPRLGTNQGGPVTCTTNTTGGGYVANGYKCYDNATTMFNYEPAGTAILGDTTPGPRKFTLPRGITPQGNNGQFIHFGITAPYTWECGAEGNPYGGYSPCAVGYPVARYYYSYYNLKGFFRPNNPFAPPGTQTYRVTFPTTGGNPTLMDGEPVTPTTRFSGRYDFSRAGTIEVKAGDNHFGGTMRYFWGLDGRWYLRQVNVSPCCVLQYGHAWRNGDLYTYNTPTYGGTVMRRTGLLAISQTFPGGGTAGCYDNRPECAENFEQTLGGTYNIFETTARWTNLLTTGGEQATQMNHYFYMTAPWTTGRISVYQPVGDTISRAVLTGYDNRTSQGFYGKMSLVVPWTTHGYQSDLDPDFEPSVLGQGATINLMTITFLGHVALPEPGGILLLGAGIVGLAGLYRLRKR